MKVDNYDITAGEVLANYQLLIERLGGNTHINTDNPVLLKTSGDKLSASTSISEMINLIAFMRLQIYLNLSKDASITASLKEFQKNLSLFKSYEYELLANKSKIIVDDYNKLRNETGLKPALKFFEEVSDKMRISDTYAPEDWWRISATGMDELRAMHQNLLKEVQASAIRVYDKSIQDQRNLLIFIIALTLLILLLVYFAIKSTTEQIDELKEAAEKMALGETGVQLPK